MGFVVRIGDWNLPTILLLILSTGGVEQVCGQADDGVDVAVFEQLGDTNPNQIKSNTENLDCA